jgi:hypothetical protein
MHTLRDCDDAEIKTVCGVMEFTARCLICKGKAWLCVHGTKAEGTGGDSSSGMRGDRDSEANLGEIVVIREMRFGGVIDVTTTACKT